MKQKKVRILFFVPSFSGGGAERVMSLLINNFDRDLFEVIVVSLKQKSMSYEVHADKFIELNVGRVLFSGYWLNKVIKQYKPDFLFSTLTYVNTYIALLDYLFNFKTILVARESTIPSINNKQRGFGFLYNFLMIIAYRRFKFIVCQSESMRADLKEKFGIPDQKMVVINNPVSTVLFDSIPNKQSRLPLFLTVAMLRKEKGIDRIIDALALVDFDFEYIIIGDGHQRTVLEKKVKDLHLVDKIKFLGFSNNPFKDFNCADVYLHGSYYEGFPNVILEAGINGIPALAYDSIGGTNEIIKNSFNGLIVNDILGYSSALNQKFWTTYDRSQIIKHTNDTYNSSVIIDKYQKLFQKNYKNIQCVE